jgi:predicted nucleotidyltransferase component of viral defense system
MIDKSNTLTAEWLEIVTKTIKAKDKILVEKTIRALLLLEGLMNSGINFIFKGGTALLLMQKEKPKRLSIDIDIIIPKPFDELGDLLTAIATKQGFTRFEGQNRKRYSEIEKGHFKFFYQPVHKTRNEEESVLLDILFEGNPYQNLIETPLTTPFLNQIGTIQTVKTPSFEDLLGDKLTAFAPNTTGIPYFKGSDSRSKEIIKQLYDIGHLFDMSENLDVVRKTFQYLAKVESEYRNLTINPTDVLEDIYQTALCIALRGNDGLGNFAELQNGIRSLGIYIYSEPFNLDKAFLLSAKAAYLARILASDQNKIQRYQGVSSIVDLVIEHPNNTKLNKLKKPYSEAFWYWWLATSTFGK